MSQPAHSASSVGNLDSEVEQKRRQKAVDDSNEFARALCWIATCSDHSELADFAADQAETRFGDALKSGVVLCDLLNALRPGTVPPSITQRPARAFETSKPQREREREREQPGALESSLLLVLLVVSLGFLRFDARPRL